MTKNLESIKKEIDKFSYKKKKQKKTQSFLHAKVELAKRKNNCNSYIDKVIISLYKEFLEKKKRLTNPKYKNEQMT